MFREQLQDVLHCAAEYSPKGGDLMERRQEKLKAAAEILRDWLAKDLADSPLAGLNIQVKPGGRQGPFAPVPWIRIYSPAHSPATTEGFYVVWLFGAQGGRVYLSVNQGTSEWRSNKMRPINDPSELVTRAALARKDLQGADVDAFPDRVSELDLEVDEVPVGHEAKYRAHNYERANVVAIEYPSGSIPVDKQLRQDLNKALELLALIYEAPEKATPPTAPTMNPPTAPKARGQGRLSAAARRAVELRATEVASAYYEARGWSVDDVSLHKLGFDLRCKLDGCELHVECKGTIGLGEEVVLTRNEVKHARDFANTCLFVVHSIDLDRTEPSNPKASGGRPLILEPWTPEERQLIPTEFIYLVRSNGRGSRRTR